MFAVKLYGVNTVDRVAEAWLKLSVAEAPPTLGMTHATALIVVLADSGSVTEYAPFRPPPPARSLPFVEKQVTPFGQLVDV